MFSNDHQSGVTSILAGIVVVVVCGFALSFLADYRLQFGSSRANSKASLEKNQRKLEQLTRSVAVASASWKKDFAPFAGQDSELEDARGIANELTAEINRLEDRKTELDTLIRQVRERSKNYRIAFQDQVRTEMTGKKLEIFNLPDGREFVDVAILGFDESGIRIRHRSGTARVRFEDLPQEWKQRVHWRPKSPSGTTTNQAFELVETESKPPLAASPNSSDDRRWSAEPQTTSVDEIAKARSRYTRFRSAYMDVRALSLEADSNLSSNLKSVPDSLETWKDRSERLNRLTQKLHAGLLRARLHLSELSPADPLLRNSIR